MATQKGFGLRGFTGKAAPILNDTQRRYLTAVQEVAQRTGAPEDAARVEEFLTAVTDDYRAELHRQYMAVLAYPPPVDATDDELVAFLGQNPLVTQVELFRLLIRSTMSFRTTFAGQKLRKRKAGALGGRSNPRNAAATQLKAWVDAQMTAPLEAREGGARAIARRLASRSPKHFNGKLDDLQRVIEKHLKAKWIKQ
ncbi:MAG: hypothetical protein KBF66_04905 [Rhodoferax sp.]|uniref:hypothetical protein n=1 Tax=Rhodoferax sp. TaxID=50421 RepID=UPI001B61115C|nr:hypothetical protein [Rhodoferax sp.]MBP9904875.1 hypothetical protein [Rhodoferax sp.]